MRGDMDRVLQETARAGSSNPSKKTGLRIRHHNGSEFEDLPKRLSVSHSRHRSGFSKSPGVALRPLCRFLQKNIGRPWNDIYSEICQSTDRRTFRGHDLLEYLGWEVYVQCTIGEDGKAYAHHRWGGRTPVSGFYVHPETGVLQWEKPVSYKVKPPTVTKIEFASYGEVVFHGKIEKYPGGMNELARVRLSLPSPLRSDRYDRTVIEKEETGWRIEYHGLYDPEEIVYRTETENGVVTKRRKDYKDLPLSHVVKTKVPNKKEIKEINRLLSLYHREPAA